jgi:hypothetical protein
MNAINAVRGNARDEAPFLNNATGEGVVLVDDARVVNAGAFGANDAVSDGSGSLRAAVCVGVRV